MLLVRFVMLKCWKVLLLIVGKLNRKLASFLTLFYPCCWCMVTFGVCGDFRNFWWCKDCWFRGRKWVEMKGMNQSRLWVQEGKLADLGLVAVPVSCPHCAPVNSASPPRSLGALLLLHFPWRGLSCSLQVLKRCQQWSERLPVLMCYQLNSGASYQCKKNVIALAVKQNWLPYVVRMRETGNWGVKITGLGAWSHPQKKMGVFVMVGSSTGFFQSVTGRSAALQDQLQDQRCR